MVASSEKVCLAWAPTFCLLLTEIQIALFHKSPPFRNIYQS